LILKPRNTFLGIQDASLLTVIKMVLRWAGPQPLLLLLQLGQYHLVFGLFESFGSVCSGFNPFPRHSLLSGFHAGPCVSRFRKRHSLQANRSGSIKNRDSARWLCALSAPFFDSGLFRSLLAFLSGATRHGSETHETTDSKEKIPWTQSLKPGQPEQ
jgi:hypothetical protein